MKKFLLVVISLSLLFYSNCKKEESDCGCDGPVVNIIADSTLLTGTIMYKTQTASWDNFYNNMFWIRYQESNCINCIHYMIVCNTDIIPAEINNRMLDGEVIEVRCAGILKSICATMIVPEGLSYQRFIITKLEIIESPD